MSYLRVSVISFIMNNRQASLKSSYIDFNHKKDVNENSLNHGANSCSIFISHGKLIKLCR